MTGPPRPRSARAQEWAKDMPARLVQAAANVLPAAYDRSCGVPADLISRSTSSDPEEWLPEAREVVAAVLRELTRADCPRTITAIDIRFWANEAERSEQ